jgi:hypothetical protein
MVALAVHANGDVADPGPGVEPRAQRVQRPIVRRHRAVSKSDCGSQEPAALAEHALLDDEIRPL